MIDLSKHTIAELEAALEAKKAAAVEPDWEAWRLAVEAWREARNLPLCAWYRDDSGKDSPGEIFKDTVRGFIAAAPHFPLAPMPAQMGEADASQALQDYMEEQHGIFLKMSEWNAAIRELSRPAVRWPGEDELREMADGVREYWMYNVDDNATWLALEMARRLKARILPESRQ